MIQGYWTLSIFISIFISGNCINCRPGGSLAPQNPKRTLIRLMSGLSLPPDLNRLSINLDSPLRFIWSDARIKVVSRLFFSMRSLNHRSRQVWRDRYRRCFVAASHMQLPKISKSMIQKKKHQWFLRFPDSFYKSILQKMPILFTQNLSENSLIFLKWSLPTDIPRCWWRNSFAVHPHALVR